MNSKKILTLALALALSLSVFAGCGNEAPAESIGSQEASVEESKASSEAENAPASEVKMVGDTVIPTQEEALKEMGLEEVPGKILCTTYNSTILAYTLGIDICGTVQTRRPVPEELKDVPTIGVVTGSSSFDFEKVIALAGDMVLGDTSVQDRLEATLDAQGIKSYYSDTHDYEHLRKTLALLGAAFGKTDKAVEILEGWDKEVAEMQKEIEGKDSPSVLIVRTGSTMATSSSYVGGLLKMLNITNATDSMDLGDTNLGYVPLDVEKIVKANPDYILIPGGDKIPGDMEFMEEVKTGEAWSSLDAVKNDKVIALTDTYYHPLADMECMSALHELLDTVY